MKIVITMLATALFTMSTFAGYSTYQWYRTYDALDEYMLMTSIERALLRRALKGCRQGGPRHMLDWNPDGGATYVLK